MKKIISNTKMLATLLMAGAAFTACSNDDNIIDEQPNGARTYKMTVDATIGEKAQTRGLYFDESALKVKWYGNDQVSVFPEAWSRTAYGALNAAASDNGSTTLTGDLTTAPSDGDNLKLLFPRATWNYMGQTGVLLSDDNSIEKKYDYAVADVTVNSVSGNAITTTTTNFASQQAIVKFTLQDKNGNALNATNLNISAASNKLVKGIGNYTKSTTHSGYTVTAGTGGFNDDESHTKLLDDDKGTKWCANGPWNVTFNTASPVQVDGYTLTTGGDTQSESGRNPKNWTLKGKLNESDEWTTIATVTNDNTMPAANTADVDFVVDNPGSYKYFYFEVTANQDGNIMQLAELQLWEGSYSAAYGDLTVTPASATSEMTVALRNENAGSDTYTLTANVGGSNYTYEKSDVTFQNGKYYEITVKMAHTVTWTASDMSGLYVPFHGVYADNNTIKGITVTASGGEQGQWSGASYINGESGTLTFTSSVGKIKSIVISAEYVNCSDSPTGWTVNGYMPATLSWSGSSDTVELPIVSGFMVNNISSIVFTLE